MILTKRHWEELRRLSIAPQATYGSARTRVQSALVHYGLAVYRGSSECRITEHGRAVNAEAWMRTEHPRKEPTR